MTFSIPTRFALRALTLATLATAGAYVALPAQAKTNYDGNWSVVIITDKGTCDRSYRYPVRITDGNVGYAGEASFNVSSMYLDKGILGCRYGSSQPQRDIRQYVDLYLGGRLLLDELVTRTYPVADFHHAIEDLEHGDLARGVLTLTS